MSGREKGGRTGTNLDETSCPTRLTSPAWGDGRAEPRDGEVGVEAHLKWTLLAKGGAGVGPVRVQEDSKVEKRRSVLGTYH